MQISRTTIAIVASILAVGCVLFVEMDTTGAEIVASGVEADVEVDANKQKRLMRNLVDFKAYCDVNKDNIIEVSNGMGQTKVVLESLADALTKASIKNVGSAYAGWLKKMMKKYSLKASMAKNMARRLDRKLRTRHGLITVSGEGKKAVAKFTGRTMGLRGTPSNWKKMLHVPLVKVLGRARSYAIVRKKAKKGKPQFTKAEIKTLWGKKCVDNEAFGRSYSMGCKRYLREHECHQHGGCMWQTGWEGK